MLRYRRYRAFLVFAIFAIFGLYYSFSGDSSWQPSHLRAPGLDKFGFSSQDTKYTQETKIDQTYQPDLGGERRPESDGASKSSTATGPGSVRAQDGDGISQKMGDANKAGGQGKTSGTANSMGDKDMDRTISNHLNTNKDSAKAVPQDDTSAISNQGHKASELEGLSGTNIGAGGEEVAPSKVLPPQPLGTIRWSQQPEHFPVTSTISLPVGTAKAIPRVQFKFGKEDKGAKKDRIQKLDTIRAVAKKNWQSYQKFAWMHDEVAPVTGGFKDPFGGWAATLVDALDTLFLMGFVKEFEEAIEAVKTIDFTRSVRDDIPLFETVIRYLGGMLGAYDVSGGRYSVLLDKSVELAEILMGAFDTPNRMPVTFYQWKPAFASQPHRAGSSVVMAELGTLSLEFTRLAQLTKEPKYYDAIDRITDAFVEWQTREGNGTTLPGLFPLNVDASGCMKPDPFSSVVSPVRNQAVFESVGPPVAVADGESRSDMGETALTQKPEGFDQRKPKAQIGSDAEDVSDVKQFSDSKKGKGSTGSGNRDDGSSSTKTTSKLVTDDDGEALSTKVDSRITTKGKQSEDLDADSSTTSRSKKTAPDYADPSVPKSKRQLDDGTSLVAKSESASTAAKNIKKTTGAPEKSTSGNPDGSARGKAEDDAPVSAGTALVESAKSATYATPTKVTSYLPEEMEICAPSNLTSNNKYGRDRYSLGGMADSTYEYFPKTYLLLGGLEDKYRGLYERSMDTAVKKLIFRPRVPGDHDILISGDYDAWYSSGFFDPSAAVDGQLLPTTGHLACFTGGMFALGSKIFDRPNDLEIATRLTEGCVWAYSITESGVMPEAFDLMACESKSDCTWDETAYAKVLDPNAEMREQMYEQQYAVWQEKEKAAQAGQAIPPYTGGLATTDVKGEGQSAKKATQSPPKYSNTIANKDSKQADEQSRDVSGSRNPQDITDSVHAPPPQNNPQKITDDHSSPNLVRRQLDDTDRIPVKKISDAASEVSEPVIEHGAIDGKAIKSGGNTGATSANQPVAVPPPNALPDEGYSARAPNSLDRQNVPPSSWQYMTPVPVGAPMPPRSRDEVAKAMIAEQNLPRGVVSISQRKYMLRPEAIESVWYMYRVTGDEHWRKVGWEMWTAVDAATSTTYGNSAIWDVTVNATDKLDSQESFWLAETLKYFFLLFSEEDVISLDEWVLNTEAHPFKRPAPKSKL